MGTGTSKRNRVPKRSDQWADPIAMKAGTFVSMATPAAVGASGVDGMEHIWAHVP